MEPVFPLELVSIILGHCGREELLRARLVCKDWNDLCLKHLTKSSHTLKLPYKKIKDLVKFIQETGSRPVLPLELTIPKENQDEPNPRGVVSVLESLLVVIDPTCPIVSLEVRKMPKSQRIDFVRLIDKISPELRALRLPKCVFDSNDVPMEEMVSTITFPKLRTLRLPLVKGLKSIFDFYSSLMSRCPAMEVLEIDNNLGTDPLDIQLSIPLQRVKSLSVHCIWDPLILLNQIRTCEGGAKLETFRCNPFDASFDPTQRPHLLELLQELAPNLRHFFHSICSLSDPLISHIPFPMLARLDVVIRLPLQEIRSRLHLNLCARMLPALTTLAIPVGRYLVTESELCTVRHLILKAPTPPMEMEITRNDYKAFFGQLFGVCPNVKRVDIEASILGHSKWISELLQCSAAVGIEEFGVWNYTGDWIGETPIAATRQDSSRTTRSMAGSQLHSGPILINVRKIRLSQGKYNLNYSTCRGESPQMFELDFGLGTHRNPKTWTRLDLDLRAICNHFPNMRSLKLSPCMLGSDYDSSWRAVQKIQSHYPDWEVNLIAHDSELFPEIFKGPFDFQ